MNLQRHLQPTILISPAQLTWSQCSSTSRFSAELFGCIADCKACIAKRLKQLGESSRPHPKHSQPGEIHSTPSSLVRWVFQTSTVDRCGLCPSLQNRVSAKAYIVQSEWYSPTHVSSMAWPNFLHISVPAIFTFIAWGQIKSSCSSGLSQSDIRKNWWSTSPCPRLIFVVSDFHSLEKSWRYQLVQMWICFQILEMLHGSLL